MGIAEVIPHVLGDLVLDAVRNESEHHVMRRQPVWQECHDLTGRDHAPDRESEVLRRCGVEDRGVRLSLLFRHGCGELFVCEAWFAQGEDLVVLAALYNTARSKD